MLEPSPKQYSPLSSDRQVPEIRENHSIFHPHPDPPPSRGREGVFAVPQSLSAMGLPKLGGECYLNAGLT